MRKAQYQPAQDQQLTDAQEVHFAKEFKKADIAGGYRRPNVREAKRENPDLKR
ncbi:YfhE-like protein [Lentibacillus persicus]|uniref:YfhE-like protein n=1 Tax=Lentibacillus persicus TaxID=640948 RepID=A0A1I1ZTA0_9BACI|nr:YfhE family protein [Lentibacillus persicus]SFE34812.1 YfhE-like protein [Lentibacillus persicus]